MLKMHYPVRAKAISSTIVVLTGTSYSNGCGKGIAIEAMNFWKAKRKSTGIALGGERIVCL